MSSPRTRYVLEMLQSGHSPAEVALALGISEERVAMIVWAALRTAQPVSRSRESIVTPEVRSRLLARMAAKFRT